jgi:hypothetical protein
VCQVIFTDTIYPTSGNVIGPVVHQPLAAWTLGTHCTSFFHCREPFGHPNISHWHPAHRHDEHWSFLSVSTAI